MAALAAMARDPKVGLDLRVAWENARMIYNTAFGKYMDDLLRTNPVDSMASTPSQNSDN